MSKAETCVACGEVIPEGGHVCPNCRKGGEGGHMRNMTFFHFSIGKYCTAYEIGAKIKELTGNSRFFVDMNTDGQERIGRWVNAEAGKIYRQDTRYILDGTDAISLPYESNKRILDAMVQSGRVDSGWFIRHGKLDMYSARMAEMLIRSFTGINDYQLNNDIELEIGWVHGWKLIEVDWQHNDISKKYVHRKQRELRTPGHKSLFKNLGGNK